MAGSGTVVLRDPDLDTQDDGGRAEMLRPPRPGPGTRHERLPRLGSADTLRQTLLASRTVLPVPAGNGQFTPGQGSLQGDGRRDGLSCRGRYRPSIVRDQTVSPENGRSIWRNPVVLTSGTGSSRNFPSVGVRLQLHADRTCSQGSAAGRDIPAGSSRDPGAQTGLERGEARRAGG